MIGAIMGGIGAIAKPIAGIFTKKQERKKVAAQGKAKAELARVEGNTEVTLTDQEWEAIQAEKSDTTWKDEYITVVVTAPIVFLLLGGIYQAFTGDPALIEGTMEGISRLQELGMDYGYLMEIVVLAAVGLKIWRKA